MAVSLLAGAALAALCGAPSLAQAQSAKRPPRIVSTSPAVGAQNVDPGLAEITVTFDQDMDGGMSWTGGGPDYPPSPQGARAAWRDQRTCVLPVTLQPGHSYRVGINSQSYRNFRSAAGVSATPSAITFATSGTGGAPAARTQAPRIVALKPLNGAKDVSPDLKELRVTFNVEMGGGCSWTGGGPEFPTIPEGQKPSWSEDHKTCVLPVELKPNSQYRLGLNSQSFRNFQSASGVPLSPIVYTFKTAAQ
jgi:hypothetical protein